MKATGIIRRVDDLDRVVIPKEIRRQFRITEGDPLEIYVTNEGILLKKYSPVGQLNDFAKEYADSLYESTKCICLITDKDEIIAVAGAPQSKYLGKSVDNFVNIAQTINDGKTKTYDYEVIVPIISNGDIVGIVELLSEKEKVGKTVLKVCQVVAEILAKQLTD